MSRHRLEARWALALGLAALVALGLAGRADAADILLDKPVRAAGLIFFPSREDPDRYYYAPVRARLARTETGLPRFSFLRYVQNVRSELGEDDVLEGEGGGIVHAVVSLGITDEELDQARSELQRVKPGARIEGPVLFDEGTFALVSSFTAENGEFTRNLVGLGAAPVLDNTKAAVSLHLTRMGSKVLWESFHTATPDISFLFSMRLSGYRSPKQAVMEADLEEVYEHESFKSDFGAAASLDAGVAIPVDEIVGAVAAGASGGAGAGALGSLPNLDVGVAGHLGGLFQSSIDEAFDELRQRGAIRIEYVGEDDELQEIIRETYDSLRDAILKPAPRLAANATSGTGAPEKKGKKKKKKAKKRSVPEATISSRKIEPGAKDPAQQLAAATQGTPPTPNASKAEKPEPKKKKPKPKKKPKQKKGSDKASKQVPPTAAAADPGCAEGTTAGQKKDPGQSFEGLAKVTFAADVCLVMRYVKRKTRQTGTFRLDLRKYTASTLEVPFAENIGDLRSLLDNAAIFRSVNLDDPLYKQREIAASLNGVGAPDFGRFLNYVAVQMRKQHEGGDTTYDEVRIDRNTFSRRGNDFKLLYGWKGDDDRDLWMGYQFRTQWSFAGGNQVETEWTPATFSAIDLAPPYERRTIQLDGSPEDLADAQVRSVTVRIYYELGGEEKVEQVTLRADRGDASRRVEFIVPLGQLDYDFEIQWRLRGNRTVSSGRGTTNSSVLYVDELPET